VVPRLAEETSYDTNSLTLDEKQDGGSAGRGYCPLTTGQVRAARAFLRWTTEKLARESGVGLATIRRAEPADGPLRMMRANALAIRRTLEMAGIEFLSKSEAGGVGVRLRLEVSKDERNAGQS